jgi:hypothetical protein
MIYGYTPGQFAGMSYEAASRKGLEITRKAAETEAWCDAIEPLIELRDIMRLMFQHVDTVHPLIARTYEAHVALTKAGLFLDSEERPTTFQIKRGAEIVAGAGFSLTLDDLEAYVAALN